eukprot:9104034-Pyramimonas_sp.AAC.1
MVPKNVFNNCRDTVVGTRLVTSILTSRCMSNLSGPPQLERHDCFSRHASVRRQTMKADLAAHVVDLVRAPRGRAQCRASENPAVEIWR